VNQDALGKAALELLRDSFAERSDEVVRPEYWTGLCPEMTIGGKVVSERPVTPRPDPAAFRRHGYFVESAVLPAAQTKALVAAIEGLRAHGWHPLFAFVFDEFLELAWTGGIRDIAAALLGRNPLLIPAVSVHFVDVGGSRGWAPHTDGIQFDDRLTTWIPLTDATLTNGCIHVVPRSEEVGEAITHFTKAETTHADAVSLLQHARALPAVAGSVLGWAFDVLHWGSVSVEASAPRVSVAYEWLGPEGSPEEHELPLLDFDDGFPPLTERLDIIARSVLSYDRFDAALLPFEELARQLQISAPADG
jgi:Phytanoyl-CoA dioxygenase (PhyH)